jgi:radical SAM protein with 4Fe4S-binding SPASM domain
MSTLPTRKIPLFQRLEIETQSNCNRECWFCPRTYDRSGIYKDEKGRPKIRQMPTDVILDVLDQAQKLGFNGEVGYYFYSEALLDPRNTMLAREASARGMKTRLHTNGDLLLHNEALCEQIIKLYDLIVMGIYDYSSEAELLDAIRFWETRLAGSHLMFSPIKRAGDPSLHSLGVPRALVPGDERMSLPDLVFENAPCHRPQIRMLIRYDGEMCHCCDDMTGAFQLGNIAEQTLESLWYSEKHVKIVRDLQMGQRNLYPLCRICPQAPSAPPSAGTRIKMRRRD